MVTIIIMALALALLKIWIIPMAGALIIDMKVCLTYYPIEIRR
jgi:hypothetical protein